MHAQAHHTSNQTACAINYKTFVFINYLYYNSIGEWWRWRLAWQQE